MHARDLMELSAALAAHSPFLIRCTGGLHHDGLHSYWSSSKCRLDRWTHDLKEAAHSIQRWPKDADLIWQGLFPTVQEILTGEVLTRIWAALVAGWDARRGSSEYDPITRSVFISHLEVRRRTLNLMVNGQGFQAREAVALNQLRRRVERWTDLLLGYLATDHDVQDFAFDVQRMRDFSGSLMHGPRSPNETTWPLVLASLRTSFPRGLSPACPNADLNHDIGAAILSCLPDAMFDGVGVLKSLWLLQYGGGRDEQGMIGDLLAVAHSGHRLLGRVEGRE